MNNAVFMIPHVRGAGFAVDVHHDPTVGSVPSVDEFDTVSTLVTQWTGLLRALTLCGYRAVELLVEVDPASATERLLLDVATLGLGSTDLAADELGDVRADEPALLVALTLDPLWPFGEPAGAPIAVPLPKQRWRRSTACLRRSTGHSAAGSRSPRTSTSPPPATGW